MSEHLYFIAIVPPNSIQDQITALKKQVAEQFDSKHALKSPPHITLHMPFKWKEKKLDSLLDVIKGINDRLVPFQIDLKDFDYFEPRVVFVNVVDNESLTNLQKEVVAECRRKLKLDNANYKNHSFHPHITIGFRDLKKPNFYEAKRHFSQQRFVKSFETTSIVLLKHDGLRWNITK